MHIIEIPTNKGANSYKLAILKIQNVLVKEIKPKDKSVTYWTF